MSVFLDRDILVCNFHRCANQEEKYLYIIELGLAMPVPSKGLYHSKNVVPGCQSQVWISVDTDKAGLVILDGDSDAALVKGLLAIVFSCYQHMTPQNLIDFNIQSWLSGLNLIQQLTPSRSHGLGAMIYAIHKKLRLLINN
ncbi:Cysteine desulfuration protein SufE [Candidatus Erwinia haradaeae]|uniref:Cysteine desulfuration protein SufE n=1 Tax=Candidatus Erwinia haradaeae TaxID=1922217 RepID=A0A451DL04_9GAMM|nr:cysteine desulfuration protein SufE [Candidatus Erwinia haradaeae]VFP87399.1 Cysteine desulfuration protein SufE [Candidatus Erwinia haradaeae]